MIASRRNEGSPRGVGSVRIIGGTWRRRTIDVADVPGLRPTPDRVRETLFNWITHALGGTLDGCSALDLFAGSGALGFEAASRGADPVVLVESHPAAITGLRLLQTSLDARQVEIRAGDALRVGAALQADGRRFDLIFLDPPFRQGWLDRSMKLAESLSSESGLLYVEAETPLTEQELTNLGLEAYRTDKAGEVFYHLLQRKKKL